ncbi:MAG: HNH endonuclease [Candidatus Dormiibacterota bacterium]
MPDRRQIGPDEKRAVLAAQGLKCFINGHPMSDEPEVEFDHIDPYSHDGPSAISNIAAVCKKHNHEKGTLSLGEYRDRLELRAFFEGVPKRRLDDLLQSKLGRGGFGHPLEADVQERSVTLYFDGGAPEPVPLYRCPSTGERYFYGLIPVSHLRNDVELQPRALEADRLWELYRHLRTHTQLAPGVGRFINGHVLLFDGQHKAAAQVWAGRKLVECKIYIDPDVRKLKETNLTAHDKLRQMPFYTSTLIEKYADLAHEDWQAFLETDGRKTEAAFVEFMRGRAGLTRAAATKRVRSALYRDILEAPQNRLRDYIAEENRGRANPLTISRLEKTFFAEFLAAPPLDDEFESETWHRDEERENVIFLFNLIVDGALDGKWNPELGDAAHKKAARLFSAGALRAWVPFLRDAVAPSLHLFENEERHRVLYRELAPTERQVIDTLVTRMLSHKVWEDPDPALNDLRYDDADRAKAMLTNAGMTPAWILGGA